MSRYLTSLIIFGAVYFLIVAMFAPGVPAGYSDQIFAEAEQISSSNVAKDLQITVTTEGTPSQSLLPENVGKFEPFNLSHVHPNNVPSVTERRANLQSGEMIAPVRDGQVMLYHENMFYSAVPVYFSVPLSEIQGPIRTIEEYNSQFIVFRPDMNTQVIETYYNQMLGSEQIKSRVEAEQQSAQYQSLGFIERIGQSVSNMITSIGAQVMKVFGDVLNPLLSIKYSLTYDFGISELFGLERPFTIGQIICYIWSLAVFIEIFMILPESSTIGTALKYVIGIGIAVPWFTFLAF